MLRAGSRPAMNHMQISPKFAVLDWSKKVGRVRLLQGCGLEEKHMEKDRTDRVLPCHALLLALSASAAADAVQSKQEA